MFVCTKCYEIAKKNVEGIKWRSAVFISPLKTIKRKVKRQRADQLVVLMWKMSHMPPNKLQQQSKFQLQNLLSLPTYQVIFRFIHTDKVDKIEGKAL